MKYFRVKALYPKNNIEIIVDSYGKYDEIWQLSAFLVSKGFKILQVWDDGKVTYLHMSQISTPNTELIFIRTCKKQ